MTGRPNADYRVLRNLAFTVLVIVTFLTLIQ